MYDNDILYEIKEIDMLIVRKILSDAKKNKDLPFSPIQGKIINYLVEKKEKIVYQRDLEKFLSLRRSTISGILQTMEKNNFIKRLDVLEDGRVKRIVLTQKSIEEYSKIRRKCAKIQQDIAKGIKKEDLDIFFRVSKQIKKNLKEESD